MKHLQRHLLVLLLALLPGVASFAGEAADSLYIFRFVQGKDAFYAPWRDNGAQLEALLTLLRAHREAILSGSTPVRVDGYCTGQAPDEENRRMAAVRSNWVKSELIGRAGVTEACFVTANHAVEYAEGVRNVVTVTLCIPVDINEAKEDLTDAADTDLRVVQQEQKAVQQEQKAVQQGQRAVQQEQKAVQQGQKAVQQEQKAIQQEQKAVQQAQKPARQAKSEAATPEQPTPIRRKEQSLSLRTNLLYDAFLLPTLGVEWRISHSIGLKLDGSFSWWGGNHGKVQKVWLVNPEVRWYLLRDKRFYVGVSGSYGEYNIYKYLPGKLLKGDTGYQGKLWNAGVTLGYQLSLSRSFSLDFNLGLGYTRSEYDSFGMTDGVRVYKKRNESKNFWGPTQAGISLVWTMGSNK